MDFVSVRLYCTRTVESTSKMYEQPTSTCICVFHCHDNVPGFFNGPMETGPPDGVCFVLSCSCTGCVCGCVSVCVSLRVDVYLAFF
ncbi:unnamed protein product [Arctogadus glacialis]